MQPDSTMERTDSGKMDAEDLLAVSKQDLVQPIFAYRNRCAGPKLQPWHDEMHADA